MRLKTKSRLLQAPTILLLILTIVGVTYAGIVQTQLPGGGVVTLWHSVPLWIFLILYFWGRRVEKQAYREY
jgi:hypothetical protein